MLVPWSNVNRNLEKRGLESKRQQMMPSLPLPWLFVIVFFLFLLLFGTKSKSKDLWCCNEQEKERKKKKGTAWYNKWTAGGCGCAHRTPRRDELNQWYRRANETNRLLSSFFFPPALFHLFPPPPPIPNEIQKIYNETRHGLAALLCWIHQGGKKKGEGGNERVE